MPPTYRNPNQEVADWARSVAAKPGSQGVPTATRVFRSTGQSLPSGLFTVMSWNSTAYSTTGMFDPTTPTRLYAPSTGIYTGTWNLGVAGGAWVEIYKNANGVYGGGTLWHYNRSTNFTEGSVFENELVQGDYIEFFAGNTGGALTTGSDNVHCFMTLRLVA